MSVFKRGKYYYYEFKLNGTRYKASTGETIEADAKRIERAVKSKLLKEIHSGKIDGTKILLDEAWEIIEIEQKAVLTRQPSERKQAQNKAVWTDFIDFLQDNHPDVEDIKSITVEHCRRYVALFRKSGKYNKLISYTDKNGKIKSYKAKSTVPKSSSVNEYITQLRKFLKVIAHKAGLERNPFDDVAKDSKNKSQRECFEIHELKAIRNFIDTGAVLETTKNNSLDHQILNGIFTICLETGLRAGDASLLKWESVNLDDNSISLVMNKTNEKVFIPMSASVRKYIEFQKSIANDEDLYVSPTLAKTYEDGADGISYRFKKMLDQLKIKNTAQVKGERAVSTKDIHSLRHTFCYLHGLYGTPKATVQSMVGHMSASMTEHYQRHITEAGKRKAIADLEKLNIAGIQDKSISKAELLKLVKTMTSKNWKEIKKKILNNEEDFE